MKKSRPAIFLPALTLAFGLWILDPARAAEEAKPRQKS